MAGVTLNNITKKFDDVTAVNDLSIQIRDKSFAILVGPSGCEKQPLSVVLPGWMR